MTTENPWMKPFHEEPARRRVGVTSHDIWSSPEFKAFCDLIGVGYGLPSKRIVIEIGAADEPILVTQTYLASRKLEDTYPTTNQHNRALETYNVVDAKKPN